MWDFHSVNEQKSLLYPMKCLARLSIRCPVHGNVVNLLKSQSTELLINLVFIKCRKLCGNSNRYI